MLRLVVTASCLAMMGMALAQSDRVMVYGGQSHDTFLGCFSCSKYSPDSIFNEYGTYGSKYSSTSIFNEYGPYGSAYSSLSACSPYASDPPVLVDAGGGFYGSLTINTSHPQAIKDSEIIAWLQGMCR